MICLTTKQLLAIMIFSMLIPITAYILFDIILPKLKSQEADHDTEGSEG